MIIKKAYTVKLTNYTLENVDKAYLLKSLNDKLKNVERTLEDANKAKLELLEAIEEAGKLEE